jgi:hypothetical protein
VRAASFNLAAFLKVRRAVCAKSGHLLAGNQNSPLRVASIEYARSLVGDTVELGRSVPVDVFALAYGEPIRRSGTKIGGLPFRPRSVAWPCLVDGTPRIFLGQWSFSESRDILPKLPADVLLLFASSITPRDDDPDWLEFEWRSQSERAPLCRAADAPKGGLLPFCCHGVRHRSVDFIELRKATAALRRAIRKETAEEFDRHELREMARFSAWKIGGLRLPSAYGEGLRHPKLPLIATLTSFYATLEQPYPYVNHPRPLQPPTIAATKRLPGFQLHHDLHNTELVWLNGARLYVTVDQRQRVHWQLQYE